MKCDVKDCYWNMWSSSPVFNHQLAMQCLSEDLQEHYDEDDDFELAPNTKECKGYLSYKEFCGVDK